MDISDLKPGATVKGILPSGNVRLVNIEKVGRTSAEIFYRDNDGKTGSQIIFEEQFSELELVSEGRFWSFDADGDRLRLAIEANRIGLAYLFDPYLAINTSLVEPLPHQITAVYGDMLSRQPLRFLLADDPGAGKTIMAGLLIKELVARGDLERCLIIAPGSLVEQWQDELGQKFKIEFDILFREMVETSRSGNPFDENNLMIARLDMLARNENLQEKLLRSKEWDLIIVDEAHRMSASAYGEEIQRTKRYLLGEKLSGLCRHFLMMTATPHSGKEESFQLFMALLDGDRFEGRFRKGVHSTDSMDMMRRLTKEELLKFDERPLFPERLAHTVKYTLSNKEASLYASVTDYVRNEMNRVQRFADVDNKKRVNIGFALQILQRRLASSTAAIHSSLKRRKERLQTDLSEAKLKARGRKTKILDENFILADELDDIDEFDQEDIDIFEEKISASATAAESIEQLEAEIATLENLERQAMALKVSGEDTKWQQLNKILDDDLIRETDGTKRKIIIFTEAKDTLIYLVNKMRTRLGKTEAVDFIHGGVLREDRRKVVQRFMQDKELIVLVANDAAGEGINLQRGHLMVNYDLPWNPNRIEQRFGRIHRIGQTEVCHLWNLVAADTREGEVYSALLEKLETVRAALEGKVFDVLGSLFEDIPLKDLLWEAIRYGEKEETRNKLKQKIEGQLDVEYIKRVLKEKKLTNDVMPEKKVQEIRLDMERVEARRLQPYHIESFFLDAFEKLGGKLRVREEGRYEIINIPIILREEDRRIGRGVALPKKFERICFDKKFIDKQPVAEFVYPGHPLLDVTINLIHQKHNHIMRQGAIMVDENDYSEEIEAIFFVEHEVQDGTILSSGLTQTVSKKVQFARISKNKTVSNGGYAPHLDLRRITDEELVLLNNELNESWLSENIEDEIKKYSVIELAQKHFNEIKDRRLPEIEKVEKEVEKRLRQEIRYWDSRASTLSEQERAGKKTRGSSTRARQRADELEERLQKRKKQLEQERKLSALPPVIKGGLLSVPKGLLEKKKFSENTNTANIPSPVHRKEVELIAMEKVMQRERELGFYPEDVSERKEGYDIISFNPKEKKYRVLEVKGRVKDAETVTVSNNEIMVGLNKKENFSLVIVTVNDNIAENPKYIWCPFKEKPEQDTRSVNYDLKKLLNRGEFS